ncbi:DUF1488 domain-containing protein [Aquamicrobium lusatiense]|uniref:DUF1488 domain-containing protein n=1 Tax=Aquamicrobium lusatiense TaxID=89772 RepID=UPI00245678AE|nr:DUF1488 domain-containing protein [Aquamicrobium lusatiense]MDH4991029.1 DUF1488 domain-containing protein [Aquamicrobium lusatiense]
MALAFPNQSRSFDDVNIGVRFIGHDGMVSVPFMVESEALRKMGFATQSESSTLAAFDAARTSIYEIARDVYSHARQTTYRITAADCV